MNLGDVLAAFGLVAVAELGDKSQLLLVTLASRGGRGRVLLGAILGIVIVQVAAVLVGGWLQQTGLDRIVTVVAGLIFIGLGLATLRSARGGDHDDDHEPSSATAARGAGVLGTTAAFVGAEFGDKTMLATGTLSAVRDPLSVWIGAVAALSLLAALAVGVGAFIGDRLPTTVIETLSGALFVIMGALLLVSVL